MRIKTTIAAAWLFGTALVATTLGTWLYGSAGSNGDYSVEADPAIVDALEGRAFSLYGGEFRPLMWPFAIVLRIPFVWAGDLLSLPAHTLYDAADLAGSDPAVQSRYLFGAVGIVAVAATVAGLAARALVAPWGSRWRAFTAVSVTLFVALNPVSLEAVKFGHPEEVLMAALIAAGLLLLGSQSWTWAAVALGLAAATKQPAMLILPAAFFMCPPDRRLRATAIGVATVIAASVPWTLGSLEGFMHQNRSVAVTDPVAQPLSPLSLWHLPEGLLIGSSEHSHIIIGGAALMLTAIVAARHRWNLPTAAGLGLIVAVLALRVVGDSYSIVYYAAPVVAGILALEVVLRRDQIGWRRLPIVTPILSVLLAQLGSHESMTTLFVRSFADHTTAANLFVLVMLFVGSAGVWLAGHRHRPRAQEPHDGAPSIDEDAEGVAATQGSTAVVARIGSRPLIYVIALPLLLFGLLVGLGQMNPKPPSVKVPPGLVPTSVERLAMSDRVSWWVGPSPMPGDLATGAFVPIAAAASERSRSAVQYQQVDADGGTISVFTGVRPEDAQETHAEISLCRRLGCPMGAQNIMTRAGEGILRGSAGDWSYRAVAPDGAVVTVYATDAAPPETVLPDLQPLGGRPSS